MLAACLSSFTCVFPQRFLPTHKTTDRHPTVRGWCESVRCVEETRSPDDIIRKDGGTDAVHSLCIRRVYSAIHTTHTSSHGSLSPIGSSPRGRHDIIMSLRVGGGKHQLPRLSQRHGVPKDVLVLQVKCMLYAVYGRGRQKHCGSSEWLLRLYHA